MLRACPDCGNGVSDAASACPKCGRPFASSVPVSVTAQAPLPVEIRPRTSWLTMGCAALVLPCMGISIVMAAVNGANPKSAPATTTVTPAAPTRPPQGAASVPATLKSIAGQMTKTSAVHGIPQPADGKESGGMLVTKVGTVAEVTAFYRDWMNAHGWTFDARNSVLDPTQGLKKSLGFTTTQTWCKRTKPITTVSIIIGSGDSTDRGKLVEMSILNLANEESCP